MGWPLAFLEGAVLSALWRMVSSKILIEWCSILLKRKVEEGWGVIEYVFLMLNRWRICESPAMTSFRSSYKRTIFIYSFVQFAFYGWYFILNICIVFWDKILLVLIWKAYLVFFLEMLFEVWTLFCAILGMIRDLEGKQSSCPFLRLSAFLYLFYGKNLLITKYNLFYLFILLKCKESQFFLLYVLWKTYGQRNMLLGNLIEMK